MVSADVRVSQLKSVANGIYEDATTTESKEFPYPTWRGIVIKQMCDEGYTILEIARVMKMCTANVIHWRNKISNILKNKPQGEAIVVGMYHDFKKEVSIAFKDDDNHYVFLTIKELRDILQVHMETELMENIIRDIKTKA